MSETQDLSALIFAKTSQGQQEIQTRSLGLAPLVRRILVLVDGKRNFNELGALLPTGSDLGLIVQELIAQGCVQALAHLEAEVPPNAGLDAGPGSSSLVADVGRVDVVSNGSPEGASAPSSQLRGRDRLPPAETRTIKENEMARNFMINSVNSIIGQNMRISLIHDIFHSESTEQLREVYLHWVQTMSDNGMGARRLPELKEKLFKVL